MKRRPILPRLLAKRFVDHAGCWIWTGASSLGTGYGSISRDGKSVSTHRASYEHHFGAIPAGKEIDHTCRIRLCFNPYHLRLVTDRENTLAPGSEAITKANAEKTHCLRGHELSGDNLLPHKLKEGRACRTCRNDKQRERRARPEVRAAHILDCRQRRIDARSKP